MNLYNNKLRKIDRHRELLLEKEQKQLQPWKVDEKSRKIISEKYPNEKPIYERTLELAEKKKRELEHLARENEIQKENEIKKLKTRWNSGKINRETFDDFVEKQKLWEKHKNSKVILLREEYDEIEKKAIEDTMFKPQLNKKFKCINKKNEDINPKKVHERLYEYNEELKNKKANLEKKNIPKFVPNINKKLPSYIKSKNKKNINEWEIYENTNNAFPNFSNNLNENEFNKINSNLDSYLNIQDGNFNEKDFLERERNFNNFEGNFKINRRISAPPKRSDSDLSFSKNNILKPKNNKNDFDLTSKGIKTAFNNLNAGSNLKNLINEKEKNELKALEENMRKKNETIKNMNNLNEKKRLSEIFPIDMFSIPFSNIKVNNLIKDQIGNSNSNNNNQYENVKKSKNKKRISTSVIEENRGKGYVYNSLDY